MKLGLGTVQFGLPYGISNKVGQVERAEVGKVLALAAANGIKILDTAAGYGSAEEVIGTSSLNQHDFSVITKTLPIKSNQIRVDGLDLLMTAFDNSLHLLGQSSLYGLMVHHPSDLLIPGGEHLFEAITELKSRGLVKKIGVSIYTEEELNKLFDRYSFDLLQVPVNVYDQRLIVSGCLRDLAQSGVEIHARSAFLQGILLMEPDDLPASLSEFRPHHEKYMLALKKKHLTPLSAALRYLEGIDEISTVLVGVQSSKQLEECITATSATASNDFDFLEFSNNNPALVDPRRWI